MGDCSGPSRDPAIIVSGLRPSRQNPKPHSSSALVPFAVGPGLRAIKLLKISKYITAPAVVTPLTTDNGNGCQAASGKHYRPQANVESCRSRLSIRCNGEKFATTTTTATAFLPRITRIARMFNGNGDNGKRRKFLLRRTTTPLAAWHLAVRRSFEGLKARRDNSRVREGPECD